MIDRLSAALLALVLLVTASAPAQPAPPSPPTRPDVLFIAVDDLNDWVAPLGGHPAAKTPHLTRLAARSVVFTRACCAAPACNPSRVALLTGRPSSTGVYHNNQPWRPVPALKDAVTLPRHFMQAGYHVAGCGKIFHGAYDDPTFWSEYRKRNRAAGDDPNRPARLPPPSGRAGGITWGPLAIADEELEDHHIVSWAIDRLKEKRDNPTDKPLFLACGLHKPHMPWQVPQKYFDLYPLDQIQLPQVPAPDAPVRRAAAGQAQRQRRRAAQP